MHHYDEIHFSTVERKRKIVRERTGQIRGDRRQEGEKEGRRKPYKCMNCAVHPSAMVGRGRTVPHIPTLVTWQTALRGQPTFTCGQKPLLQRKLHSKCLALLET